MIVLRRLLEMAAVIAALSILLFHLLHWMPGSPEDALVAQSTELTREDIDRLRALRGADRPILERYGCWLLGHGDRSADDACAYWPSAGLLSGDLGWSRVHKLPVRALLWERLSASLRLTVPAFGLAAIAAALLGLIAALRRGGTFDRVLRLLCVAGAAVPAHWLGMITIAIFALGLGWFPSSGMESLRAGGFASRLHHALLPIAVLTLLYAATWTRYARAAVLETLGQDYVRTARATGLSERRVLIHHVLRNALIPLVTVMAQSLPSLAGGVLVVETVFAYPGMGVLILESVEGQDHLVAMVAFLMVAAVTMLATVAADLLYWFLDPRVREPALLERR